MSAVSDQALRALLEQIRVGMTEREIAKLLEELMLEHGAQGPSFDTIVAGGPGGALPHWVPTDRKVQAGDFPVRVNCRPEVTLVVLQR